MQYITPHEKLQVAVIVGQDLDKSWTEFYHFCFIMLRVKRNPPIKVGSSQQMWRASNRPFGLPQE